MLWACFGLALGLLKACLEYFWAALSEKISVSSRRGARFAKTMHGSLSLCREKWQNFLFFSLEEEDKENKVLSPSLEKDGKALPSSL